MLYDFIFDEKIINILLQVIFRPLDAIKRVKTSSYHVLQQYLHTKLVLSEIRLSTEI